MPTWYGCNRWHLTPLQRHRRPCHLDNTAAAPTWHAGVACPASVSACLPACRAVSDCQCCCASTLLSTPQCHHPHPITLSMQATLQPCNPATLQPVAHIPPSP